jgi:hypothetical protein
MKKTTNKQIKSNQNWSKYPPQGSYKPLYVLKDYYDDVERLAKDWGVKKSIITQKALELFIKLAIDKKTNDAAINSFVKENVKALKELKEKVSHQSQAFNELGKALEKNLK